jgi:hypothetical protein
MAKRANPLRLDPSRTGLLRRKGEAMFKRLIREVNKRIEESHKVSPWWYSTSVDVIQFKKRLNETLTDHLISTKWWEPLIQAAYEKGVGRTATSTRFPGGKDTLLDLVDRLQRTGGEVVTNAMFRDVRGRFLSPRAQEMSTRFQSEMDGVTAATSQTMARVLLDGLAKGNKVGTIARALAKVLDTLTRSRATLVVRSEIVRAAAEGQLDAAQALGHGVKLNAEVQTAEDEKVCPRCLELSYYTLTPEDARGVIPVHPGCRCSWDIVEAPPDQQPKAKKRAADDDVPF